MCRAAKSIYDARLLHQLPAASPFPHRIVRGKRPPSTKLPSRRYTSPQVKTLEFKKSISSYTCVM